MGVAPVASGYCGSSRVAPAIGLPPQPSRLDDPPASTCCSASGVKRTCMLLAVVTLHSLVRQGFASATLLAAPEFPGSRRCYPLSERGSVISVFVSLEN